MPIPGHVCAVLGCGADLDKQAFADLLDSLNAATLPWFLSEPESRSAFVEALFDERLQTSVELLAEVPVQEQYGYRSFTEDGEELCSVLSVPSSPPLGAFVSTNGLQDLARAWPAHEALVSADAVDQIPSELNGRVVFFTHRLHPAWDRVDQRRSVLALCGIRQSESSSVGPPDWTAMSRFNMSKGGMASDAQLRVGQLLQEAVKESRLRWRFISLYRIFEAAYLLGLREKFLKDFLSNPRAIVSEVQDALGSELVSFQNLVESKRLTAHFDGIRASIDADNRNRFLYAIKRKKKGEASQQGWKQGVAWIYSVRCAIVHAGPSDVVYDGYSDGEDALKLVIPLLEAAVMDLLGIAPA